MDRFWNTFKSQASIEETVEEPSEKLGGEPTKEAAVVPDGYELIEVQQPDGTVVAVRRKLATWQLTHRDSLASVQPDSSTPSFRTVTSRTSDGRLARVQRPVRDVSTTLGASSGPRQARPVAKRASSSSSVLSGRPARDTMRSTMTIVEDALAEQLSNAPVRHSGRDGSAITTASGTAISGTSGDIHIGHIEELNEYDNESDYASSDYDADCYSEDGQNTDGIDRNAYRKCACLVLSLGRKIADFLQPIPVVRFSKLQTSLSRNWSTSMLKSFHHRHPHHTFPHETLCRHPQHTFQHETPCRGVIQPDFVHTNVTPSSISHLRTPGPMSGSGDSDKAGRV